MVRVTKLELHRTISDIMKKGDLSQLTTKKIRLLCEQKYNVDLSSRKDEIDKICISFINNCNKGKENEKKAKSSESGSEDSGSSSSDESGSSHSEQENSDDESCSKSSSCSESECSYSSDGESAPKKNRTPTSSQKSKVSLQKPTTVPAKKSVTSKKQKAVNSRSKKAAASASTEKTKDSPAKRAVTELDDAAYARQLQAEEWNFRQRTVKKLFRNVPQKKSDTNEKTKKKKASPFMKKCLLSPALAEVLGTSEMSRPDVVQKMWAVVRERNLFDTSNKQYAICDEQLFKIFGKKRIRVIGMMKYLKNHIKDQH